MHRKQKIIGIFILLCSQVLLFSESIELGGSAGWSGLHLSGVKLSPDTQAGIILKDNEYNVEAGTEMLFHFNEDIVDYSGTYRLKQNQGVKISKTMKKKGDGSATFTGDGNFLELIPSESALFAAGSGRLDDFTIEFWLNPARLSEGEHILQWNGAIKTDQKTLQQEILCGISGRGIFWDFSNLFLKSNLEGSDFRLTSSRSLIPKRWHHHMIRYESSTGLLEYLIDGIPEDIVYTSPTKKEDSELYQPLIGSAKPAAFLIGRDYTGFIDELRIISAKIDPELEQYDLKTGSARTAVYDLGFFDSRFNGISADYQIPGKTRIYFYYRIDNTYFRPDSTSPGWKLFEPDTLLVPDIKGRYLQLKAELLPDGTGGNSPELKTVSINFDENIPPRPPQYVSATEGNGEVVLKWKPVTDADTAGYKIYYGSRPGIYFGTDAEEGGSPVDAGSQTTFRISGLSNGKLYYFAVTTYDDAELPHESTFSREISARPSALTGN